MGPDETMIVPGAGKVYFAPAGTELPTADDLKGWTHLGHAMTGLAGAFTALSDAVEDASYAIDEFVGKEWSVEIKAASGTAILDEIFDPLLYIDGEWWSRKDLAAAMVELGITEATASRDHRRWVRATRLNWGRLPKHERKAELSLARRQKRILRIAGRHRQRRLIGIKA